MLCKQIRVYYKYTTKITILKLKHITGIYLHYNMPFWGVVMGVVNIIMGVVRGRYHQLPVGVAMVPEGSLKKLEPMVWAHTRWCRMGVCNNSPFTLA